MGTGAVIDHVSIEVRANISMFKKSQSNFKSNERTKYHFSLPLYFLDVFYSSAIVYVGKSDEEQENYKSR